MGETDGMYKLENGRWSRTKTDWSIFELYLKYKVNPSFFVRTRKNHDEDDDRVPGDGQRNQDSGTFGPCQPARQHFQLGRRAGKSKRQDVPVGWEAAVFLNDTSTSLAHEIQFNTEDSAFAKASVHMDARGFLPGRKAVSG